MLSQLIPSRRGSESLGYGPLSDFWYAPVGRAVSSGVNVTADTAMTYSAVWACTRLLSATAGRLPLNLYKRSKDRGKAIAVGDARNRLTFRQPNAQMIPMLFKSQGVAQQVNAGNSYAEIQRDKKGSPVAFWPIHHSRVKPVIDEKTDELYYRIKNNNYSTTDIEAADILHFPSMMSEDGICGKGVIANARESIGMGLATEQSGASFFGSGGIPRVVVESPKKWSDASRQNFRKEWKEIYGGPNGDKVGVMDEGSKLHLLNISQQDSQFLETRQHNVEEICRWYGVPPHKVQHLLRATFNNIEHMSMEFINDALMPWLVIWEEELDKKLLAEDEQEEMFFAFKVSEYIRGDTVARGQYHQSMVNSGIERRNEARIEEDLNPVEGGDTFLVQGAMVALDEDGRPTPSATQPAPAEQPDDTPADDAEDSTDPADEGETDAPSEDAAPAEDATATAKEVVRIVLQDTLSRMIRKEATAARRAANKSREFLKWMDEFYPKHQELLAEALGFAEQAAASLSLIFSAACAAERWCEQSKAALLKASETTADKLPEAIEQLATEWETHRAAEIVREFFERAER